MIGPMGLPEALMGKCSPRHGGSVDPPANRWYLPAPEIINEGKRR